MPHIKKCFVLMPFNQELKDIYLNVYKSVCEANDISCQRVDESFKPAPIPKEIIEGILDADIVIADITSENPNVFYELGFAHTAGKHTIITAERGPRIPFDIRSCRVIFYERSAAGIHGLSKDVDSAIKETLENFDRISNPVWDVLDKRNLIMADKHKPVLRKDRIQQLIELHRGSSEHLIFLAITNTLYRMKVNKKHYDIDSFASELYVELVKSKELCSGFQGRVIGDIYQFLKERFTEEQLRNILEPMKPDELAKGDLLIVLAKARIFIKREVQKILGKIKQEIDERED